MRKCPACASQVPAEASVCAHCRSKLPRVDARWWTASDGLLYAPWQHPDGARLPARPTRSTRNPLLIAAGVLAVLILLGAGVWYLDVGGVQCAWYRDRLQEAKADRGLDGGTFEERDAVESAARTARSHGCDVDDLVDPSVGR